jgi:hypothetical protein
LSGPLGFILGICVTAALLGPTRRAQAEPGDELTISVVTMEPGDEVWEKFGHNTIRVRDAANGIDLIYNWGVFDFDQQQFFIKFARGRMDYSMQSMPTPGTLDFYASQNRTIWEQELNLSAAQKLRLRDALVKNDTDENRFYRYNYYTDNCSTRVRDAITGVLDEDARSKLQSKQTKTTFRWHTRRLTQGDLFWYSALNTVLGPAIDRPINAWEESFLPLKLQEHLRSLTIATADGREQPLVKLERTLFQSTRSPEPQAPPNWIAQYFLVGLVISLVLCGLAHLAPRRKVARVAFFFAASLYALFIGVCGCIGLFFWFLTDHVAAWRNSNLFCYSPLALPLVILIPMMARKSRRVVSLARVLSIMVAASTVAGLLLKPMLRQVNGEPMALVLPANIALAWVVWRFSQARQRRDPSHEEVHLPPHPQRSS